MAWTMGCLAAGTGPRAMHAENPDQLQGGHYRTDCTRRRRTRAAMKRFGDFGGDVTCVPCWYWVHEEDGEPETDEEDVEDEAE